VLIEQSVPGVFTTTVLSNDRLCDEHYRLTLQCDAFPEARVGQFVHVLCCPSGAVGESAPARSPVDTPTATIRRAFSISDLERAGTSATISLIYRVVGVGTAWLENVRAGDTVNVLGPLGNGFSIPTEKRRAYLVSGGVGLPPMIWLAKVLRTAGAEAVSFFGAQSKRLIPLTLPHDEDVPGDPSRACEHVAEFASAGVPVVLSTDDGSVGVSGFVTDALARYAETHRAEPEDAVVYTCGPEPMMRAVASWCHTQGIECQVCMERAMACGMGTCQSCVVPCRDTTREEGWRYRLCCTDGPVFDSREVIWD